GIRQGGDIARESGRYEYRHLLTWAVDDSQNATRMPPLTTRPSSGAHASTVHRPSAAGTGRISRPQRLCLTSPRFSAFTNTRTRPIRRSTSAPYKTYGTLSERYGLSSRRCGPV